MAEKRQKKMAVIACLVLLFVTFASLFYIAKEEIHDCTGADCPICACVRQAKQTLKNLGNCLQSMFCAAMYLVAKSVLLTATLIYICTASLVSQKVRLND